MPGRSSHGTVIQRAPAASPQSFTTIGEIGDITLPGLMRNEFDVTPHNRDIDSYVLGVLRRDPVTFPVFFDADDATHDSSTGLYASVKAGDIDGWKITQPDGLTWLFSGGISAIAPTAPVDGVQTANITIRPSGPFYLDGVLVGGDIIP